MTHFSQPEPINHNELKRLLNEIVDEVYSTFRQSGITHTVTYDVDGKEVKVDIQTYLHHKIDRAILNGDDS